MTRSPRTATGQFPAGVSGNPNGRPRRDAAPTPQTALAHTPTTPARRRDGWINSESGHGTHRDRRRLTRYGVDIVTDIEAQQLWRSEFLAAAIIEQGPREAFSRGWHFKCEDKKITEAIAEDVKRIGATKAVVDAAMKENALGGAAIFPVLSGSLGDLSEPLDESGIASVDALHVLEPQELTPVQWYGDIREPKFRKPMTYRLIPLTVGRAGYVPTVEIHESRLIILPGTQVSVQTQAGQRLGWGDSALCRPWTVIADFGLAWGSAATLLHNHGKETLEMDGFANIMAQSDGVQEFDRYLDAMYNAWSTLRMNVIDGKSKISRATGTLAGVSDLLNEFKVLMAASARRPVSVLMGQSQSGLRTGDDDTRTWYKTVESDRADRWNHPLERIAQLLLLATAGPTGGKEPELWSIEYPPLWAPTEKEVAETRKTDMDRAVAAVGAQIASADDVAGSFYGGDTYSGDIHIDWERREAQAKIAEQSAGDLSPEDQAAMGRDGGEDLSDDELDELTALQEEFGTDEEPTDEPDEDQRTDAVGVSAGGHGYNPYRAKDGKFGAGAHKAKPSAGPHSSPAVGARAALGKAKAAAEVARANPSAKNVKVARAAIAKAYDGGGPAKSSKAAADIEAAHRHVEGRNYAAARTLFEKHGHMPEQHVADQMSRAGFPVKIKAPKSSPVTAPAVAPPAAKPVASPVSAGHSAPASTPRAASVAPPAAAAASKEALATRQAHAADSSRRAVIAQGRTGQVVQGPNGDSRQFTPAAQVAIREHHDAVISTYELYNLDAGRPGNRKLSVDNSMKMGGQQVYGCHDGSGAATLWGGVADHMSKHASQDPASLTQLGQRAKSGDKEAVRMIDSYRVSTHEALHGYGPKVSGGPHGTMLDEVTTEMVARRITGDLHGIPAHEMPGSYDRYLHPVVNATAAATGKSFPEAWHAVTEASLAFKREEGREEGSVGVHGGEYLDKLAAHAMTTLGHRDPAAHAALGSQFKEIGMTKYQREVSDKYPSENRYL